MAEETPAQGIIARTRSWIARTAGAALERRPWLRPAGVVAFIVLLAVVLPGYIATQPRFFARFRSTQKFYVTWAASTHAEVACQSCHVRPSIVSQAEHSARMLGEFYLSALLPGHSPAVFPKPTNEACEGCHYATRTVSPSGDLKIPHRAHVAVLKMRCVRCHKYAVHFKNPEGTHSPRMTACLVCHDGKKAKNECAACHKGKRLPVNHRLPSWVIIHPKQQAKMDCRRCHGWVKDWCRKCHEQRPRSHVARWRSVHRFKVAKHRNCEACHESKFCVRCHGEVPRLNRLRAPKFVK